MTSAELTEMVPVPEGGRTYSQPARPGLADCAPSGRIRLDALARWLQDVAYADVEDAGLAQTAVWVIRRARIDVKRFPRFGEHFAGERDGASAVEAVALWVHLDPATLRPTPLSAEELTAYGGGAADLRRVTARLRHPQPPPSAEPALWRFRATECDIAGHINNSAYWQPLEEDLLSGPDLESIDVEIEYRNPAQPGEKRLHRDGPRLWISDGDGQAHASIWVTGARAL
jgi:acyl-ACP thioesterase